MKDSLCNHIADQRKAEIRVDWRCPRQRLEWRGRDARQHLGRVECARVKDARRLALQARLLREHLTPRQHRAASFVRRRIDRRRNEPDFGRNVGQLGVKRRNQAAIDSDANQKRREKLCDRSLIALNSLEEKRNNR